MPKGDNDIQKPDSNRVKRPRSIHHDSIYIVSVLIYALHYDSLLDF
jgi:hypothetical protein